MQAARTRARDQPREGATRAPWHARARKTPHSGTHAGNPTLRPMRTQPPDQTYRVLHLTPSLFELTAQIGPAQQLPRTPPHSPSRLSFQPPMPVHAYQGRIQVNFCRHRHPLNSGAILCKSGQIWRTSNQIRPKLPTFMDSGPNLARTESASVEIAANSSSHKCRCARTCARPVQLWMRTAPIRRDVPGMPRKAQACTELGRAGASPSGCMGEVSRAAKRARKANPAPCSVTAGSNGTRSLPPTAARERRP